MKLRIWPFNRNSDQDSTLPAEVQDYYQAEKRERTSIASLLAIGTLLTTIALALGLFFGGRWVYRAVFDSNDTTPTTEQQDEQQEVGDDQPSDQEDTVPTQPSTITPTPTPAQTPNTGPLPRTGPESDL